MKKIAALFMVLLLVVCVIQERAAIADPSSNYGLYGTIKYPQAVVSGASVTIYKKDANGNYVQLGSTTASACGYYTYDTGSRGEFRAYVNGYYTLRNEACNSIVDNEQVAGDNYGSINFWSTQAQLDVMTY